MSLHSTAFKSTRNVFEKIQNILCVYNFVCSYTVSFTSSLVNPFLHHESPLRPRETLEGFEALLRRLNPSLCHGFLSE